ncbi:MAG: sigma-70 family RNA polymerase sigma factor [Phycisphaeraceae bacterium]|nr:sigma-70 family RNA polymerase sigma factor [Phycisphaerales bacterium]MCB9860183.1 sigma-70 family RNA polymerase sigma factor [Phycisphaeraceae bacterium]
MRDWQASLLAQDTHEQSLETAAQTPPAASESIAGLLARMRHGDQAALATVYSTWFDRALAMTMRLTKFDESFCLDVVQDSMLVLAKKPPKVECEAQFAAWLGRVVCRKALDHIKADKRRKKRESASAEHRSAHHAASPDLVAQLQQSMKLLKDEDAIALVLRFDKDLTLQSTAESLGITKGAAHGRIRRAVEKIGEQMKEAVTDRVD